MCLVAVHPVIRARLSTPPTAYTIRQNDGTNLELVLSILFLVVCVMFAGLEAGDLGEEVRIPEGSLG